MKHVHVLKTAASALALAGGLLLAPVAHAGVSIGIGVPLSVGPQYYGPPPVYYQPPPPSYYNAPPPGTYATNTDAYGNTVVISQPTPGTIVTQPVGQPSPYYGYGNPYYAPVVVDPFFFGGYAVGGHHHR